jgi:hypothetical protein
MKEIIMSFHKTKLISWNPSLVNPIKISRKRRKIEPSSSNIVNHLPMIRNKIIAKSNQKASS